MSHSLASSAQYLRYSRKWSLSVLVTTRAMSLQKPRWQALMLSFRRSSWAFPPETRSTSLITQITEHLSTVCRTRVRKKVDGISVVESAVQWWSFPTAFSTLAPHSGLLLHSLHQPRKQLVDTHVCRSHTLSWASICLSEPWTGLAPMSRPPLLGILHTSALYHSSSQTVQGSSLSPRGDLCALHLRVHRTLSTWPTRTPSFLQNDWQSSKDQCSGPRPVGHMCHLTGGLFKTTFAHLARS